MAKVCLSPQIRSLFSNSASLPRLSWPWPSTFPPAGSGRRAHNHVRSQSTWNSPLPSLFPPPVVPVTPFSCRAAFPGTMSAGTFPKEGTTCLLQILSRPNHWIPTSMHGLCSHLGYELSRDHHVQLCRLHTAYPRGGHPHFKCAILWPQAQSVLLPTLLCLAATRFADLVTSKLAKHRLASCDRGPAVTEVQL